MPGTTISHDLPTITLNRDLTLSPLPAIVLREIPKIMGEVPSRYPIKPPDPPVNQSICPQPIKPPVDDIPKRHTEPPSCDSSDGLSNTTTSCASSSSSSVNYEHFSSAYSESSSVPRTYIHQSVRQSILCKKMSSSEESVFKMTFDEWRLLTPEQRRGKTASDSIVDWKTLPTWYQQPPLRSSTAKYNLSSEINEKLVLWKGDISRLVCEAIVNETDERCMGCGSPQEVNLYQNAGRLLERECASFIGDIKVGQVRVTKGYKLPSLFVLHTLGPEGQNPDKLRSCYSAVLNLCIKMGIRTVAIPCIGTARHIYPVDKACHVGLQSIREWMQVSSNLEKLDRCILVCNSPLEYRTYKEICPIYFPTEKAITHKETAITSPRSKKKPIVPILITTPSLTLPPTPVDAPTPNISSPKLVPSSPPSQVTPTPQISKEVELSAVVDPPTSVPVVNNTPIRISVPKNIRKISTNKETEAETVSTVLGEEMPSPPPRPTPRHNRPAAVLTLNPNAILPTSSDPRLPIQTSSTPCEAQPKPKSTPIKISKPSLETENPNSQAQSSSGRKTPSRSHPTINAQPTPTDEMPSPTPPPQPTDSNVTVVPQTVLSPRKKKERCLSPSASRENQVLSPRKTGSKCLPSSPKTTSTTPSKSSPRAWSTWMWDKGHL